MKILFGILIATCVPLAHAAIWVESVVATVEGLRERGFVIEAHASAGAIPSMEISVRVPTDSDAEQFIKTSMVIADYTISGDNIEVADRNGTPPRTERKEREARFTLFGKSAERCYLSIEFLCPDAKGMRHERSYLLPLANLISQGKAGQKE